MMHKEDWSTGLVLSGNEIGSGTFTIVLHAMSSKTYICQFLAWSSMHCRFTSFRVEVGARIRVKKVMRFGQSFWWIPVGVSPRNLIGMQFNCQRSPPELCFEFGGKEGTFRAVVFS